MFKVSWGRMPSCSAFLSSTGKLTPFGWGTSSPSSSSSTTISWWWSRLFKRVLSFERKTSSDGQRMLSNADRREKLLAFWRMWSNTVFSVIILHFSSSTSRKCPSSTTRKMLITIAKTHCKAEERWKNVFQNHKGQYNHLWSCTFI